MSNKKTARKSARKNCKEKQQKEEKEGKYTQPMYNIEKGRRQPASDYQQVKKKIVTKNKIKAKIT